MNNQRGVTLIELLVVIAIMGIISAPVFLVVNNTMNVHQETSVKNQLQHEARFITQYMSDMLRDGAKIERTGQTWQLKKGAEVFITYDSSGKMAFFKDTPTILSGNITEFDVGDGRETQKVDVKLSLELKGQKFMTNTTIYFDPMSRYSAN